MGSVPFFAWEVAGKPASVRLRFDVIDQLLDETMRGFGALRRRGIEVGGVLLGSVAGRDPYVVRIEEARPIECRHARGPSFLLTDEERAKLEANLAAWRAQQPANLQVVGFYRSHTRDGLFLDEEDLDLFDQCFPEPFSVALLVKPYAFRTSTGGFFIREDGKVRAEAPYLEFPFKRAELEPEPELRAGAPASRPRSAPRALLMVSFLVGMFIGLLAAIGVQTVWDAAGGNAYSLSLRVNASDSSLHVGWDRQAPALRAAVSGVLVIQDGDYQKTVALDVEQLRNGSVIYRRATGNVQFRLEVTQEGGSVVSESVSFAVAGASAAR